MASQLVNPNGEAAIWARLMDAQGETLPLAAAEYLLSIRFGKADRKRMQELAELSNAGSITDEELAEFDTYLHIGNLLAVMQARTHAAVHRSQQ